MEREIQHPAYATLAGFALIGSGLCLARYAYTPLIPALIDGGWVDKAGAGYLGGFNCLGYILGCVAALELPRRISIRWILRVALILVPAGLVMCAWDFGFAWLAIGRAISGFGGAALVIHTPAVALAPVPDAWKKVSNGIVFSGAGSTIALVSLVLPLFLVSGVMAGWLFQAGLGLGVIALAWVLAGSAPGAPHRAREAAPALESDRRWPLALLGSSYVLAAVGITPHMLFLSDYLHRDLGVSLSASMHFFALVGAGSLFGAATSGLLARGLGTSFALLFNYVLGCSAVALVLLTHSLLVASVSAFCIGFFLMQCVALTSMKTNEIVGLPRHPKWWGILTLGFGLGLAVGAYGFSGLLSLGLEYIDTFRIAQGILLLALVLFACSGLRRRYEVK
ncbi:MAG: YbfB/YjiJ family MFS transporter [Myxococcota bacterium]|nr:YbfB/YjiJ family MFS transporter [Myxococcota bacterium]